MKRIKFVLACQIPQLRRKILGLDSFSSQISLSRTVHTVGHDADDPSYVDLPKPRTRKSERKPYPTPMKLLIKRRKEERAANKNQPCRMLEYPPDNGLLVPDLIDIAHRVHFSWKSLLFGMSKLVEFIPVQRCRFCFEVHIGRVGHEIRTCTGAKSGFRSSTHEWKKGRFQDLIFFPKCYHLHDRVVKPRVGHDERHNIPRIPAILELCIQAGIDLEHYPCKRRTKPVYCVEGRIVDFESVEENLLSKNGEQGMQFDGITRNSCTRDICSPMDSHNEDVNSLSIITLNSWLEMLSGAKKIMEKYSVQTCGYCPEVQVGPKGHKVRTCKASKHQSRNGMHAWQEATIDDLVFPNHVWHVRDLQGPALDNKLKRFYGKVPAVVELCVQAGATIPNEYRSMMRLDIVPPERDEVDLIA